MATLQLPHSHLYVKYLYDNNGSPYFQIRVPADLKNRFNNRTKISIPLHVEDGAPVIQVQRLANNHKLLFRALRADPSLTLTDEKAAALAFLRKYDLKEGDGNFYLKPHEPGAEYDRQPHLAHFLDDLNRIQQKRQLNPHEQLALRALKGPLPTALSELPEIYFNDHKRGKDKTFRRNQLAYWNKLVCFATDIPVEALDRQKARQYVEMRLSQDVTKATVEKEVKILGAILTRGIRELGLQCQNPFSALTIPSGLGKPSRKREKFSEKEHLSVIQAAIAANDEVRTVLLVCALTGCRIAEAVGLRKQDCFLDTATPHISFENYGQRRLKTKVSVRKFPVLPELRSAIESQMIRAGDGAALFPRYNDMDKPPSAVAASGAVNKWIRSTLGIDKTCHGLRHSANDLLRNVDTPQDLREEMLGWGPQTHADGYGDGRALEIKFGYLEKAIARLASQ